MVVWEHRNIFGKHQIAITILIFRTGHASDGHCFSAAGKLPKKFIAAAQGIIRTWSLGYGQRVGEFHAVDNFIGQACALANVKLITVAVAGAKTLVALAGFVQRVEVHDQVKLVMGAGCHPSKGVGIVGTGFVEDRKSFAMAGTIYGSSGRSKQCHCDQVFGRS